MDWSAIGVIADLASALAVALSLVYLAVQLRLFKQQSARQLRIHQQAMADRTRISVWSSPEVADFLVRCRNAIDPLEPVDRLRHGLYMDQWFWAYWTVYVDRGSDVEWRRLRVGLADLMASPAAREAWREQRHRHSADSSREVDSLIDCVGAART